MPLCINVVNFLKHLLVTNKFDIQKLVFHFLHYPINTFWHFVFYYSADVYVPTGIAAFPHEFGHTPRSWAKKKYKNIVTYNYMPSGGHFAAFEEPELLAQDIKKFVRKVEHLS